MITSEPLLSSRNIIWNTPFDFEFRHTQGTLTTDAAMAGWGAVLTIGSQYWTTSGFFQIQDGLVSSNQRETAAVLKSLNDFLPVLSSNTIRAPDLQSDNMTTVCNMARQNAGTNLLKLTRAIFSILLRADIRLSPKHIPGVQNTLADSLSRLDRAGDYELKQEFYQKGLQTLGLYPTVDCFANKNNTKCRRFFAPHSNALAQGAAGIDAMKQD
jgi:hypothetical protein